MPISEVLALTLSEGTLCALALVDGLLLRQLQELDCLSTLLEVTEVLVFGKRGFSADATGSTSLQASIVEEVGEVAIIL